MMPTKSKKDDLRMSRPNSPTDLQRKRSQSKMKKFPDGSRMSLGEMKKSYHEVPSRYEDTSLHNHTYDDQGRLPNPSSPPNNDSSDGKRGSRLKSSAKDGDASHEQGKGASFSIGLGSHNLFGGIHFGKHKRDKDTSHTPITTKSNIKSGKDDPLAYGSFNTDHLAYPETPCSKASSESSRSRPASIRYTSPPSNFSDYFEPRTYQIHPDIVDVFRHLSLNPNDPCLKSRAHQSTIHPRNLSDNFYGGPHQVLSPMPSPPLMPPPYPSSHPSSPRPSPHATNPQSPHPSMPYPPSPCMSPPYPSSPQPASPQPASTQFPSPQTSPPQPSTPQLSSSHPSSPQPLSPGLSSIYTLSPCLTSPHPETSYFESISSNSSTDEQTTHMSRRKPRRTARFHDPKEEATILAKVLSSEKSPPDTAPLISILPGHTHDQILQLRSQYKRLVKTNREKKPVNIAKHIKKRLRCQPSLMKACFACALGQWESEGYWVTYWYQGQKNRIELLIESLMGRSKEEIRMIKKSFRDKKYENDLSRCLQTELREGKLKKAIMLALEEDRMDDQPDGTIDRKLINDDIITLRKAICSKRGGESSAIIDIFVSRSETYLRELLNVYYSIYGKNFAKEILGRPETDVGELLAHIINGVINAPVRDALLLHQALDLPSCDKARIDLLVSRLVRYHWDRPHMELVRTEYRHRFNTDLQTAFANSSLGDLGLFLEGLCVRRVEGDVRVLNS